jgi:hypothetical protein
MYVCVYVCMFICVSVHITVVEALDVLLAASVMSIYIYIYILCMYAHAL